MISVTELDISKRIGRVVKSPILVSSLEHLGIHEETFLTYFSSVFEGLIWDMYDVEIAKANFLIDQFPSKKQYILNSMKKFFLHEDFKPSFSELTKDLTIEKRSYCNSINPWRKRGMATFEINRNGDELNVNRIYEEEFSQDVESNDIRSFPRKFKEVNEDYVGHRLFEDLLRAVFSLVEQKRRGAINLKVNVHFMRLVTVDGHVSTNSPEGAHEDGSDFIISALVINRHNISGGRSQIIERKKNGHKEVIYEHLLQPGEFVFQSDSKDELTFGTDLWHHVTPCTIENPLLGGGYRDIIGLDIDIV